MKLVSFSVPTYDLDGTIQLEVPASQEGVGNRSRRISVVETLDGGVAVTSNGAGQLGTNITYKFQPTAAQAATLRHLIETYDILEMANEDGFYTVAPISLNFAPGFATLVVTIITKEAN